MIIPPRRERLVARNQSVEGFDAKRLLSKPAITQKLTSPSHHSRQNRKEVKMYAQDVCCFPFLLLLGVPFTYLILQPVQHLVQKQKHREKRPTKFSLTDIFWLMLLLQIPLAYLVAATKWQDATQVTIVGGLLLLMFVFLWWRGISLLGRLGIDEPLRRGVYLAAIVPVAVLGAFATAVLTVFIFNIMMNWEQDNFRPIEMFYIFGMIALVVIVAMVFRRLTNWVLAGSSQELTIADDMSPDEVVDSET